MEVGNTFGIDNLQFFNITTIKNASCQQRFGVMGADVLRMKICAEFELCASYQHLWYKSATTPSRKTLAVILS